MNPRHFYFIFLGAVVAASNTRVDTNVNVTVVTKDSNTCDTSESAIDNSTGEEPVISGGGEPVLSSGGTESKKSETDNKTASNLSDVQRIVLQPGKTILFTVDPCASGSTPSSTNLNGIPLEALKGIDKQSDDPNSKPKTIIPQVIVPAAPPIAPRDSDNEIQSLIDQQPDLNNLSAEDLNVQVKRFIEFLDISRQAALNKMIKWPRLVLLGEDDDVKYKLIETLIGSSGILTPQGNVMKTVPRFPGAIRFTLKNDVKVEKMTISIDGVKMTTEGGGSLFAALKANKTIKTATDALLLTETAVEVEITGKTVPSLVFIDLPWKTPESNKDTNDRILAQLFQKYLRQTWNFNVVVGNGNAPFDQWKTLNLVRTFDEKMRRVYPVSVDPPTGEDEKINGMILGLQETLPILKKGRMFAIASPDDSALNSRTFCENVKCGKAKLLRGLQIELLRHWYANRPDALRLIASIMEPLKSRITGYDGYWDKGASIDVEQKWKALMGQLLPILHDNLVFFPEERDDSACTGSSLDLVKDSIFQKDQTAPEPAKISWTTVFNHYQNEVSRLPRAPASVDWTRVKSLIADLKAYGPKKEIISNLKLVVLKPQLESLKVPKLHLIELAKLQWKQRLSQALEKKFSLEAFTEFKAAALKVADSIFSKQVEIINNVNKEIDESDESVGWFLNFPQSETSSFWLDLMKSESVDSALKMFRDTVETGFVEICSRQIVLQPRFIIKNLLTRQIVQKIVDALQAAATDKLTLTKMSQESIAALKTLQSRLNLYEQLTKY